jgi:hypothetical protein
MKLKRFSQFVKESLITESSSVIEIEENIFLIDEIIYVIWLVTMDVSFDYEPDDNSVGFVGGYSVDDVDFDGVDGVYKVTDPSVISQVKAMLDSPEAEELKSMGFEGADEYAAIGDLIYDADQEEITGEELNDFINKFKALYDSNTLVDLTGTFKKRTDSALDRAVEDFEPDEPDYDDYDDDRY